ncbi:VanZ family protein [Arthrobacter sp. PAMC 25486]|uniref:VanZ family protein n=1 Tax=Arthrobacter sp. PAMC 25486 TaxID=1494608 RepID=UPI0012FE8381|nr:VanZ family protein [Arthrobacter sp. PAMC 25486]
MSTTSHKLAVILAAVYFAALAVILFWPFPVDRPIDSALMQVITWLHNHGLPQWFIGYRKVEFAANILLFIPFGIIVALRLHRRLWWLSIVIAAAVSGAVELAQAIFLPQRVPAWSDIVANTSGAFLGALLVLFVWSLRRHRALRASRNMV